MLAQLVARAAAHVPPMGILAGAGVSDTNVDELVRVTGVREVHGKNAGCIYIVLHVCHVYRYLTQFWYTDVPWCLSMFLGVSRCLSIP